MKASGCIIISHTVNGRIFFLTGRKEPIIAAERNFGLLQKHGSQVIRRGGVPISSVKINPADGASARFIYRFPFINTII